MSMKSDIYSQITANKSKSVLLIGVFLVLIIAFGWAISGYYGNPIFLYIATIFSFIQAWAGYYYSDKIALATAKAIPVTGKENRETKNLVNTIQNLTITAGVPMPKVYVIDDSAPNAFATGRDPQHASIAVTTGLIEKLEDEELQGVLAHELSHIKNYDIRVMSLVVVLVGIIAVVSDFFLRSMFWGNRRSNDNDNGGGIMIVIALVLAILAPIAATLIQLAVSRKREFLADASGALLTRYPEGLASALEKIAKDKEPLEVANRGTAHLYILSPFKKENISSWFSTHPPITERINRLKAM